MALQWFMFWSVLYWSNVAALQQSDLHKRSVHLETNKAIQKPTVQFRFLNDVRNVKQLANQAPSSYGVFILYCGSKSHYGYSWCPMCHALESYIKQLAYYMPEETMLIYAEVGTTEQWQDPLNPFRTACRIKLTTVPTLQNWRTGEKLEGHHLFDFSRLMKFLGIYSFQNWGRNKATVPKQMR